MSSKLSFVRHPNASRPLQCCGLRRIVGRAGKRRHVFTCGLEQLEDRRLLSWTQQGDPLSASDAGAQQRFGESVSIDGDTAVVGRPLDQNAVVFVRDDPTSCASPPSPGERWCEQDILVPDPTPAGQHPQFGWSVALSGDTAIVGAFGADDAGGAYIFKRNAADDPWLQQAELHEIVPPELLTAGDNFGNSVAIDGDTAVVGALAGEAAYVFQRVGTTWTFQAKLAALVPTGQDHFGRSVGVNNNTIIVGAGFADGSVPHGGAAYIFHKSNGAWGASCDTSGAIPVCENAKLIPRGGSEEQFGWSAAIEDTSGDGKADTVAVSSHNANAAYVFEKQGGEWGSSCPSPSTSRCQHATLSSGGGDVTGGVDIDGGTIVVGSPQDDGATKDSGAAYVFKRGAGWQDGSANQDDKLTASNGRRNDRFGRSVSVSAGTVLVGAIYANGSVNNSGAVYVFGEPSPGISVSPTSGLVTSETGGTAAFEVVLDTAPEEDVIIGISSSDTSEGTVDTTSLTFTPSNWNVPQTVTVTGVDDPDTDGDVAYTIVTAAAVSTDTDYGSLDASDVSVINQDDDAANVEVTSISPDSMPINSTVTVTIFGSGFADGADVTFVGSRAPSASDIIVNETGTQITATVKSHKRFGGTYDVVVTNLDATSGEVPMGFTVDPAAQAAAAALPRYVLGNANMDGEVNLSNSAILVSTTRRMGDARRVNEEPERNRDVSSHDFLIPIHHFNRSHRSGSVPEQSFSEVAVVSKLVDVTAAQTDFGLLDDLESVIEDLAGAVAHLLT